MPANEAVNLLCHSWNINGSLWYWFCHWEEPGNPFLGSSGCWEVTKLPGWMGDGDQQGLKLRKILGMLTGWLSLYTQWVGCHESDHSPLCNKGLFFLL